MIIACDALFIQRQALHSGLTKYMIDTLSKTPLTYQVDGTLKSLGGPGKNTDDLINRCFVHMASWLRMVIHACEAEFPRFSLLRAFQVFHVGLHDCASPDMPTFFKKLAHVYKHLGVEAGPLETEFRDIAPYARHAYNTAPSRGVTAAWKSARDKTQANTSVRQNHTMRHLGPIGERLVCFRGMNTSKNEHAFADQKTITDGSRGAGKSEYVEVGELKVKHDLKPDEEDKVIARAQEKWRAHNGQPRLSGSELRKPSLAKGIARPRKAIKILKLL